MWWCQDDKFVEFFDTCSEPDFWEEGPKLHYFGSTNFKNEEEYLRKCWHEYVETEVIIPAHLICTEDRDGNVERMHTDYLNGPLFTEFTSLRSQNQLEPIEMPLQANDSSSTSENADKCASSVLYDANDYHQKPNCDQGEEVCLRLIGGEHLLPVLSLLNTSFPVVPSNCFCDILHYVVWRVWVFFKSSVRVVCSVISTLKRTTSLD